MVDGRLGRKLYHYTITYASVFQGQGQIQKGLGTYQSSITSSQIRAKLWLIILLRRAASESILTLKRVTSHRKKDHTGFLNVYRRNAPSTLHWDLGKVTRRVHARPRFVSECHHATATAAPTETCCFSSDVGRLLALHEPVLLSPAIDWGVSELPQTTFSFVTLEGPPRALVSSRCGWCAGRKGPLLNQRWDLSRRGSSVKQNRTPPQNRSQGD